MCARLKAAWVCKYMLRAAAAARFLSHTRNTKKNAKVRAQLNRQAEQPFLSEPPTRPPPHHPRESSNEGAFGVRVLDSLAF